MEVIDQVPNMSSRFDSADKHYARGDYEEASTIIESLVHDGVEDGCVYYKLGIMYYKGLSKPLDKKKATHLFELAIAKLNNQLRQNSANKHHFFCLGMMYTNGYGVKEDKLIGLSYLLSSAEQGLPDAQYYYALSMDAIKHQDDAFKYCKLAADQHHSDAQTALGIMYSSGTHACPQNYQEALKYYELAASQGNPRAQYNLAVLYSTAKGGVCQDFQKAFDYYKESANHGYPRAQYNLAIIYDNGTLPLTTKDPDNAFKYYYLAAENGHPASQFKVALIFENRGNLSDSLKYLNMTIEQGYFLREAHFQLGEIYSKLNESQEAFNHYKISADSGNPHAQFLLGRFFGSSGSANLSSINLGAPTCSSVADNGRLNNSLNLVDYFVKSGENSYHRDNISTDNNASYDNVTSKSSVNLAEDKPQNNISIDVMREQSFQYFKFAADQGHPEAQFNVARMYRGGVGTNVDHTEAIRYYKLSADQGHPIAQCNLALVYAKGIEGILEPNVQEAIKYFMLSAKQGNSKAQFNLGVINASGMGGIEKNYSQAYRYYCLAACQGNSKAIEYLENQKQNLSNKSLISSK